MKKLMSMILSLLMLMTGFALAEGAQVSELKWTEKVTYHGDGIFEIDFMKDIPWRAEYILTVKDDAGNPLTLTALGGDANEAVVQVQGEIREDALYTFSLVSSDSVISAVGQSTRGLSYANYCEYCLAFGHDDDQCGDRQAAGVIDVDRCDLCGELTHDDDSCPTRQSGEYCDECGAYGHDDDSCVYDDDLNDCCDFCGEYGHDEDDCINRVQPTPMPKADGGVQSSEQKIAASPTPQPKAEYCDDCREYGHDDDNCPNEKCDECGKSGHDDDNCPNEKCDECGKTGHDDDNCPDEKCDECGQTGHDDDNCPNEKCDECGQSGHDDDSCPNEKCDECGQSGHDDDDCPNEKDDDDDD